VDEAIAECREALRLKKDLPVAHYNLGHACFQKGQLDEAVAAYREAIRLKKDFPKAHYDLGTVLRAKGQLDEAVAEFREAIRLQKDFPEAHNNLGATLLEKGRPGEAIAECREAVRLKKDFAEAHNNLGVALSRLGRREEAIAEYRAALRLKELYPEAHYSLGRDLLQKGHFREAVEELRRADELGFPRAQVQAELRPAEQWARLDERLPAVLQGMDRPKDAAECLAFARLCQASCRQRYAASARFYADAFAAGPRLAENLQAADRYYAARTAALAGTGRGQDVAGLDATERARLRRQALDWLRADLAARRRRLEKRPDRGRIAAAGTLRRWLEEDSGFAGVRGPEALAKLPATERQAWQQLWNDVAALSSWAQGKTGAEKKSDAK
jgi:Flp pilus assembly protein TadD